MELEQQPQKLNRKYLFMMPLFLVGAIGAFVYLHNHDNCVTYYDRTGTNVLWKDCD